MCLFLCQEQPILQAHFLLQQPVQYQNSTGGSSGGKRQTIIECKALTYMRIFRVNLVFLKITLVRWLCWQEHLGLDSIKLNTAMTRPCWTWLRVRCWKNHLLRGSGFESATANGNISMLKKILTGYKNPNKTENGPMPRTIQSPHVQKHSFPAWMYYSEVFPVPATVIWQVQAQLSEKRKMRKCWDMLSQDWHLKAIS